MVLNHTSTDGSLSSDGFASSPLISIIMPSFNQANYLEEAICSILDQEYPNIELIVIDGGSTDGSVEILQRFSSAIAHWESTPDGGQSEALNKGVQYITGEIVGWLNSDDTYSHNAFHKVAQVFENRNVRIAMSSCFGLMDADGNVYDYKENTYTDHRTLIRFWATNGMTINQPSVFFRRELLEGLVPIFDTSLHYAMDYDFWLRLTRRNDIKLVQGHWANYRFHETSKSGTGFGKFYPEWYAVSQHFWGERSSRTWWANWLHHAYYHYPRRIFLGIARRLRGFQVA